jgi:hypothetical protein
MRPWRPRPSLRVVGDAKTRSAPSQTGYGSRDQVTGIDIFVENLGRLTRGERSISVADKEAGY